MTSSQGTETYTDPWTGEPRERDAVPAPDLGRAWCSECRGFRQVEDQTTGSTMTPRGEVEYPVTQLACGHQDQGPERVVAAAPGAPYAGPDVAVARTPLGAEVRAARAVQRMYDRRQVGDL